MSKVKLLDRVAQLVDVARHGARVLAPLATRLVIGIGFVMTGLGKWKHLDATTSFFESSGIPAPFVNAVFVSSLELIGGAMLVVGFLTRPIALLLSSTMVVALLTADRAAFLGAFGGGSRGLTDIAAVVFLMFLLWLAGTGAGAVSLDAALAQPGRFARPTARLDAAQA